MNSYWIESTEVDVNFFTLAENLSCDVCIIGAGLFGLTTAYYLSKKGLNVIVLDKSEIGEKVSGHTTAKITSQHGIIYNYLIQSFGTDIAKKYLFANEEAIKNIKEIVSTENINCDLINQSNYVYTTNNDEIDILKKEVQAVKSLGFNCQFVEKTSLPFEVCGAIMFPNQSSFHPRKYMIGLCNCILNNSGQIFTNTLVYDVKKEDNYYKTITSNHCIKSKYVVLATHYPFINFPGFYFTKMYQETSYIIGIDTKEDFLDGMYITAQAPTYSFRAVKDGNKNILLIGGGNHKTGADNISYNSTYALLEKKAKELYPNCELLYKWNTRDCITLDKVPYIGEFSSLLPNMYVGTGFNKWGMTSSNVAANIVTDNILGIKNKYEKAFTSTRLKPIKNIGEVKNMLKQTASSLVVKKIKIPDSNIQDLKNGDGKIIEIDGNKIGIYKDSSGNMHAVKPTCTHLGCTLSWNNIDKTWDCPCHGSRFDYNGINIYDPAIKNLEIYNL
ncbi:MAG: FAD-dependent oxidoreductase [Clostridia bacterium]|nr:FAD-dependent oxidoreductase [Clostridia bacterium]